MTEKKQPAAPDSDALEQWQQRFHKELYDSVLPFWLNHSVDAKHGGYYNCLDRDGRIWDRTKHVWLQGRQVWMLSKIYNETKDEKYLEAAKTGAKFLRVHGRTENNRVYFSLAEDGRPVYMQRKIFSECFYAMAMAEHGRAIGSSELREESREMFGAILRFAEDPSLVNRPVYEGEAKKSALAVPMIILNLIDELRDPGEKIWEDKEEWCVEKIRHHVRPELNLVLETVGPDGSLLDSSEGRLVNPGHAIEAGWFLLDFARRSGRGELKEMALNMIRWSMDFGWDEEFDGLYYFMDREGFSPSQLEWNMKLWWPHCEAMVALLMAWLETGDAEWWQRFEQVATYSFENFSDPEYGEWFGYLDRYGKVTHNFKGGPYKGCFHVPRALWLCDEMLKEAAKKGS